MTSVRILRHQSGLLIHYRGTLCIIQFVMLHLNGVGGTVSCMMELTCILIFSLISPMRGIVFTRFFGIIGRSSREGCQGVAEM